MKILYRIAIFLVIAGGCAFLLQNPPSPSPGQVMAAYVHPVRGELPVYKENGNAYRQISDGQKLLYDAICGGVLENAPSVSVAVGNFTGFDVETALFSVLDDCPEFFWVDFSGSSYQTGDTGMTVHLRYLYEGDQLAAMKQQLDETVSAILGEMAAVTGEYGRALFLHDRIAAIAAYDRTQQTANIHNAYGALAGGLAVCDGYAHAYQLLMQAAGMECHYVPGTAEGEEGTLGHAWNIARLDGVYTNIDLTWNDKDTETLPEIDAGPEVVSHAFFGLSDGEMSATHTVEENFQYPFPAGTADGWFLRHGLSGSSAEGIAAGAAEMLIQNLDKATPFVEIQLTDKESFHQFTESYDDGVKFIIDEANRMLADAGREETFAESMYRYVTDADRGCILIFCTLA